MEKSNKKLFFMPRQLPTVPLRQNFFFFKLIEICTCGIKFGENSKNKEKEKSKFGGIPIWDLDQLKKSKRRLGSPT